MIVDVEKIKDSVMEANGLEHNINIFSVDASVLDNRNDTDNLCCNEISQFYTHGLNRHVAWFDEYRDVWIIKEISVAGKVLSLDPPSDPTEMYYIRADGELDLKYPWKHYDNMKSDKIEPNSLLSMCLRKIKGDCF